MNFIGCCFCRTWKPPLYIFNQTGGAVNQSLHPRGPGFPRSGSSDSWCAHPCARVRGLPDREGAPRWELAKVCHSRLERVLQFVFVESRRPWASRPPFSQANTQGARERVGLEPGWNCEASLEATSTLACPPPPALRGDSIPFPTQITEGRHLSQHRPCA